MTINPGTRTYRRRSQESGLRSIRKKGEKGRLKCNRHAINYGNNRVFSAHKILNVFRKLLKLRFRSKTNNADILQVGLLAEFIKQR